MVYVIREEDGQRKSYQLDLRSADILVVTHYLKQSDVVYVRPNSVRAGQSTINQNAMKSVSLWISIASFAHIDRRARSQHCKRLIRNINTIPHLKITCKQYQAKTA